MFSMKHTVLVLLPATIAALAVAQAQEPGPGRAGKKTASVNTQPRVDVLKMDRPIEMHDTVWIEDLTSLEIRDSLKAGKTTAIVMAGGMEENGPYLTMGKHNNVMRAQGESIARRLGNALCAPIITVEPGNPERSSSPGSVVISEEAYEGVLTGMANSLKAQGFKDIIFLGDHGGDQRGINTVSKALNEKWKGSGVNTWYVADFYDYGAVEEFEKNVLGIHEKLEGYHDDYYISSIIMTVDVNGVRLPERRKAHKTTINGVDLEPSAKTIENGKKIVEYRTDVTVKALQKMMAEAKSASSQQ
jgi:creatinine amidohydrolase/Fe(II)-dependent formamide hydrolase-like protein